MRGALLTAAFEKLGGSVNDRLWPGLRLAAKWRIGAHCGSCGSPKTAIQMLKSRADVSSVP